jgi:hypothetical protein
MYKEVWLCTTTLHKSALLPENQQNVTRKSAPLSTSVLASSQRKVEARHENAVKGLVKFIRKGMHFQ